MRGKEGERGGKVASGAERGSGPERRRASRAATDRPNPARAAPDPAALADGRPDADEGGLSRVPKTERILNLIAFLLRRREPVLIEEILTKVHGYVDESVNRESLMRRFERDKKVLREMGLPIQFCTDVGGEEGYTLPRDSYYLGAVTLPPGSLALLRALAAAMARGPGGRLEEDLRSALLKLGFDAGPLAPDIIASAAGSLGDSLLDLKIASSEESDRLDVLGEAVLLRRRVRFTYYAIGRDETSVRDVDPYGLGFSGQGWHKGAWYLVGYCHKREGVRVFKLERIRGLVENSPVRGEAPEFDVPEGFQVAEHLAQPRWELAELAAALRGPESGAPAECLAQIRVDPRMLPELRELVPSARDIGADERGITLELPVRVRRPFLRFVLHSLGRVEILEPPELCAELRDLAREILAKYK